MTYHIIVEIIRILIIIISFLLLTIASRRYIKLRYKGDYLWYAELCHALAVIVCALSMVVHIAVIVFIWADKLKKEKEEINKKIQTEWPVM